MNNTSINDHFSQDHDRLGELFRQFQTLKSSDYGKAVKAFEEFKAGLERHIVWEEEILFPAFEKKSGNSDGPTEVMRWEHRQIRSFLNAIAEKLAGEDGNTSMEEMGLHAMLTQHNQKEENILYPMIDQLTGAEERTGMFAAMNAIPSDWN